MRNDHVFFAVDASELPSPEELERAMAEARRMRSAAMHEYLARAWAWACVALRPRRAPQDPVGQCC
jgi:hypothetical protein